MTDLRTYEVDNGTGVNEVMTYDEMVAFIKDESIKFNLRPHIEIYRGYKLIVKLNDLLYTYCGYIETTHEEAEALSEEYVHGDWTYANYDNESSVATIGFDCAHASDLYAVRDADGIRLLLGGTYRTPMFVIGELKRVIDVYLDGEL